MNFLIVSLVVVALVGCSESASPPGTDKPVTSDGEQAWVRTGYDDLNSFEKKFEPQECGIFLFPAHLDHYVTPSNSNLERYSISFNYNLDGKFFGDCNNHLTIKVL